MAWLEVALGLLKLANLLLGYVDREQARQAGRNEVIAEILLKIADRLQLRDKIRAELAAMSDAELDDELLRIGDARGVHPKATD